MDQRNIKTNIVGAIAFRGKFKDWLQDEYQHGKRTYRGQNCNTCSKCVRCRIGFCLGGHWERDFGGCRSASIAQTVWPEGAMRTGKIINCINNRPWPSRKTPEFGYIQELSDPKPDDEQPRNQCSWCELVLQNNMSVHRKFCMKMQRNMRLARQRATNRSYG